ncbi:Alpha-D-ribose 1-methylphosphonate 5-triphosphate synthase subunit PhnH [Afipia felis]|uniref:Alpha-D-ribose 1-methylphosphonate 5-triphosphate synthase subunit PhnH n=1 Tax=Afipia felis TaxID=1035 RepID=A0A090MTA7_AFIFE|nr:phosphonate C-P lyase system protein PhnH [Afipia felis]CEG10561.1 Alpha-D-ribose 1-methylphosphonate 5-triphosphate synthase subunit PhnH [Afipia felis]
MTLLTQSTDKVFSAQFTFRAVMNAMARPGTVQKLDHAATAPAPMTSGTAAIALALFDQDTPLWLDPAMARTAEVAEWLRFHTGSPIVDDPARSHFALIGDPADLPAFDHFALGTSDYPDRSTTLIMQVESLSEGPAVELRGPGINGAAELRMALRPAGLLDRLAANTALFPLGIDLVLVADDAVLALPRSTRVTAKGD